MLEHVKNLKYLLFYFLMSCFLQYLCVLTFEIRTLECRTNFYSFLLQGWTVPVAGSLWPAHTEHDLWPGQRELPLHGQILWQRDPAPHQEDQPDRPAEALAASRAAGQPGRHRGPARQPDLLQHRRLTTPSGQYCTLIEKKICWWGGVKVIPVYHWFVNDICMFKFHFHPPSTHCHGHFSFRRFFSNSADSNTVSSLYCIRICILFEFKKLDSHSNVMDPDLQPWEFENPNPSNGFAELTFLLFRVGSGSRLKNSRVEFGFSFRLWV